MPAEESKKYIFLAVVLSAAIAFLTVIYYIEVVGQYLIWILLLVGFFILLWKTDVLLKLKEYERTVIFRLGRVHRVGGPGWCIVIPFIEAYNLVDLRVQTLDVARQEIVTKGKMAIHIDAVIYLFVKKQKENVIKSVIEVENYKEASVKYVISQLRDVMGAMFLHHIIAGIDRINERLTRQLAEITEEWGVGVRAVVIKDIDIPRDVLNAMHAEKIAEQEKLARMEKAVATRAEIRAVKEAAEELSDRAINYYFIQALAEMSKGKGTKIVFPLELSSLAKSLGGRIAGLEGKSDVGEAITAIAKAYAEGKGAKEKKEGPGKG